MDPESGSTPSGDASSRPSDNSENDSPITPPSFTHNHVVADCHLKNFNHVLDAFKSAAERLSTNNQSGHKYASLHALLLSWEEDDLGVGEEVANLGNVLVDQYAFEVRYWEIPIKKSTIKLTRLIVDWTEEHEGDDKLLLVYYAGHGWMDSSRQAIWSNRRKRDELYAELKWSGCEEVLHESVSDTLFLLDCCHAGSSISQALKGFSETIAASGFEYIAPLPGPHSFTNALTRILFEWSRMSQSFTVAALHAEILTYLKIIPPDQLTRDGLALATASTSMEMRTFEWRRTPVHYIRSTYKYISSIILAPKSEYREPSINLDESHIPKPDNGPRVVLSISLTEDIRADDAESCRRWLTDFPLPTQDITVEAVFKSLSTVVLVSIALEVWDVLPEIPGCNFVCYSRSRNLLGIRTKPDSVEWDVKLLQPASWGSRESYSNSRIIDKIVELYSESESIDRMQDEQRLIMSGIHYGALKMLLQPTTTMGKLSIPSGHQRRLSRLSTVQILEISTDLLVKLTSREGKGSDRSGLDIPSFLQPEYKLNLKRIEAQQELSTLEYYRLRTLAENVVWELEQRFPRSLQGNISTDSQRIDILHPSAKLFKNPFTTERTPFPILRGAPSKVVAKPVKPDLRVQPPETLSNTTPWPEAEATEEAGYTTTSSPTSQQDYVTGGIPLPPPSPSPELIHSNELQDIPPNPFARHVIREENSVGDYISVENLISSLTSDFLDEYRPNSMHAGRNLENDDANVPPIFQDLAFGESKDETVPSGPRDQRSDEHK